MERTSFISSKSAEEIVHRSFLLVAEQAVDDDDIETIGKQSADINPYAKRCMLEKARDTEFIASIEHPEYTFKED